MFVCIGCFAWCLVWICFVLGLITWCSFRCLCWWCSACLPVGLVVTCDCEMCVLICFAVFSVCGV